MEVAARARQDLREVFIRVAPLLPLIWLFLNFITIKLTATENSMNPSIELHPKVVIEYLFDSRYEPCELEVCP